MVRCIAVVALFLLPLTCRGAEVAGVKLPDNAQVGGQALVLNGAGLRTKAFFRVYVAGLYLVSKRTVPAEVLAVAGPKRVSMVLLRDVVAQQLIDALVLGVRDNHSPAETEKLWPRVQMLIKVMTDIGAARKGSVINIDFLPDSGTQISLDGASKGERIPGDDFYRALLRIWLGEDPAEESLKKALLGASDT